MLPDDVIENTRKLHVGPDSFHKPSMMIDAERNQPLEVEVIFGAIVRLAQERGVSLPVSTIKLPFNTCDIWVILTSLF